MSETKSTPGPWTWRPEDGFIVDSRFNVVAEVPCQGANDADGPLISAAPIGAELAELVLGSNPDFLTLQSRRWDEIVAKAREFKAEAEGSSRRSRRHGDIGGQIAARNF